MQSNRTHAIAKCFRHIDAALPGAGPVRVGGPSISRGFSRDRKRGRSVVPVTSHPDPLQEQARASIPPPPPSQPPIHYADVQTKPRAPSPAVGAAAAQAAGPASASGQPTARKPKIIKGGKLHGLAATLSPWVWAVQGLDADHVLPRPQAQTLARTIFAAKPLYLSPASLQFELPKTQLSQHTEVAVLGRSNVGKSSLIAALLGGDSQLVRVSKTPGCTQTINFYTLQGQPLFLVDLPGYGFARAPEQARSSWMETIQGYLDARSMSVLRRVLLLVDARHGVKPVDEEAMSVFDHNAVPYQVVLTKADAVRGEPAQRLVLQQVVATALKHRACLPIVHLTSAKEGSGLQELRNSLAALVLAE